MHFSYFPSKENNYLEGTKDAIKIMVLESKVVISSIMLKLMILQQK